jgi:glyoxylase-like metal-dependent hydrolase (beta-lactamase superfamily II)
MRAAFKKGLVELNPGAYGYLQPDGGWGLSNAGLIVDGDQAMLVDTLFDEPMTAEMLTTMHKATGFAAPDIQHLVNTHGHGDHTYGNALLENAAIYASASSAREIEAVTPALLARMKLAGAAGQLGIGGQYFAEVFAPYDFAKSRGKAPTHTFTGKHEIAVGDKRVALLEVGPAHTIGDVLVHCPADRTVFTGDILFIDSTPLMWTGPLSNLLRACNLILELDAEYIVPGHGPLTDRAGVRRVQDYLVYIDREARKRFDAGLSAEEAARDIALGDYAAWGDSERIAVNVDTLYRSYSGDTTAPDALEIFGRMGRIAADRRRETKRTAADE